MFLFRSFLMAVVLLLITSFWTETSHAQMSAGITIIPAFVEELVDPGAERTFTFVVTNESGEDKEYFIYARDIKGVEDGGRPIFADPNEEKTGFELTQWLSLGESSIRVPAGSSVEIPVTMRVPQDASPGSHFGGVFVSVEPPRLREIGAGVGYEVASVISIRISGDVIDTARVRAFSTDRLVYGDGNISFDAKIENQGNILIRPSGPVTITGMFGGQPQVFMVNDNRAGVFPGTVRDFEFDVTLDGFAFGRYEAVLALSYDAAYGQKTIDSSVVFWVFPAKILLIVLGVFAAIFLIGYALVRYYINQAIMRASGGRRIVSARYRRRGGVSRVLFVFVSVMSALALFLVALLILLA
jgi:hypothetical protein